MRTARLHGAGDLRLHDEPDPVPAAGEELVRVTAVGLCGSDRHWYTEGGIGDAALRRPLVLGHELAGVIVGGERDGERVAVDPADPCLRCPTCLGAGGHLCPNLRFLGHGETDGGLRSLLAWPGRLLHRLPESLPDAEAALLEPLGVALHAIDLVGVAPRRAGVFGCGPIGLLLVQLLRALGWASVVATDVLAHRVAAARAMGATEAIAADPDGAPPAGLPAVDVAFEVAGSDGSLADAIEGAVAGGRVVLVGIPEGDRTSFAAAAARRKELTLHLCRRMTADDLPRAIGLADDRRVELAALISSRYPLAEAATAFAALVARRGLKVVVEPSGAFGDKPAIDR